MAVLMIQKKMRRVHFRLLCSMRCMGQQLPNYSNY
ncbi:hypothetical protein T01_13742 [Trichinella spiralis]|uniref:Uncharacterized protein n=1 Tax=Trichinella spiralis TaxID=6334 RepID=A0A0V0YPL3_TRISP|nr:hypothetical protein T01_8794 [Trichinella spiralis]KRY06304.1 hypothetical protein T01_13742 [Trichinella spiralis]